MLVFVEGKAFDVRFERHVVPVTHNRKMGGLSTDLTTTKTICKISEKLDLNGKGRDNYVRVVEESVTRNIKDKVDNKDLARKLALTKALVYADLCGVVMFSRKSGNRQMFWDAYFANYPSGNEEFDKDAFDRHAKNIVANMPTKADPVKAMSAATK